VLDVLRGSKHLGVVVSLLGAVIVLALQLSVDAGWLVSVGAAGVGLLAYTNYRRGMSRLSICADPLKALVTYEVWWPLARLAGAVAAAAGGVWLGLEATTGFLGGIVNINSKEALAAFASVLSVIGGFLAKTFVEGLTSVDESVATRVVTAFEDQLGEHIKAEYKKDTSTSNQFIWLLVTQDEGDWSTSKAREANAEKVGIWLQDHPCLS
jgi:hypothetical protein